MISLLLLSARADVPPHAPTEPVEQTGQTHEPAEPVAPVEHAPLVEPVVVDKPIAITIDMPESPPVIGTLIPRADLAMRGPWSAFLLLVLAGILLAGSAGLGRVKRLLRPIGLLPTALSATARGGRGLAAVAALAAAIALLPPAYAPALPWMILAAAAALGWSARDVLPDLIGGVVIRIDRRVQVGQRIIGKGVVSDLGLLTTTLADGSRTHAVPNRTLLTNTLQIEDARWPEVEIWLTLSESASATTIRAALREAALTTPWGAPGARPDIQQDPAVPQRWRVAMRVLDEGFIGAFQGSLRERTQERLSAAPPPEARG